MHINPARFPFFYGWIIIGVGTLGVLASLPGQTIGVAAFTESLLQSLTMSRTQISLAYMIGTMASAFLLTFAGMGFDRFGARRTAATAASALGLTLLAFSQIDRIVTGLSAHISLFSEADIGFGVLVIAFFCLRFSGQGVLTMASRNVMMKWFDRYRGRVTAITGLVIAPMFSLAPQIMNAGVERLGWRITWQLLALTSGLGFAVLSLLFLRDNPERYDLLPDGPWRDRKRKNDHPHPTEKRNYTLKEAAKTFRFWVFAVGIGLSGFYVTGLSFHIASVFGAAGLDPQDGFKVFFPAAMIALLLRPLVGWSADRLPLRYILAFMMLSLCLSGLGLWSLARGWGIWLLITGNGLAGSAFEPLMSVVWPSFFGRAHLGAISSLAMSVTVFSSSLGPVLFSLGLTATGSYAGSGLGMIGISAALAVLALLTREENADLPPAAERCPAHG